MQNFDIQVLVDNTAIRRDLDTEHGLSMWVTTGRTHLLFDTGLGIALADNATVLGADLRLTDVIVLSHGHFDHTGGLKHVFSLDISPQIYMHPDAVRMRYGCLQSPPHKPIGMPEEIAAILAGKTAHISHTSRPTQVAQRIWVTGPIPRRTAFEDTGGPFYVDADCLVPDAIIDDQALWLETEMGIVVLLGCAHSGVVNTLDYIAALSGQRRFHAVIGGMHLLNASPERLDATIEALRRYEVNLVGPCHCTGESPMSLLMEKFPTQFVRVGAGSTFTFRARGVPL